MFDRSQPLWLPEGSVRSILALSVVGAAIAGAVSWEVAGLVLAFYFKERGDATRP